MKPTLDSSRFAVLFAATTLAAALAACGQTGPLYLPAKPAAVAPAKSEAAKPAPERAPAGNTAPGAPATAPATK